MRFLVCVSAAVVAALLLPAVASARTCPAALEPSAGSLAALIAGEADFDSFQSRWETPPETDLTLTPFDFQVFGGWGRILPSQAGTGFNQTEEQALDDWNPFKNQDAYSYGVYALIHEKMMFVLPGIRMEFNNIDEYVLLSLDIAGPAAFCSYKDGLRIGSSILADATSDISLAFHGLFAMHFYLLGEIIGPYVGPIFGFNCFYFRGEALFAYPILGGDAGIRLNFAGLTLCAGAMVYGMAMKHVHPDYGFEFYGGIGFLI